MEYPKEVKNRLKRVEGQMRGVLKMIEEGKACKDVITQLSAVRSAIDRTIGIIVSCNLVECAQNGVLNGERTEDLVKEAVDLLIKSR